MRILAVDDEKIALEVLVNAIREAEPEAEIYNFGKAKEALDFYRENACEVAFLDVQMRNMSGIELGKQMKRIRPEVNIIFATGYGEYMGDAFQMHASGYLGKPVTARKVREELDHLRYPVLPEVTKRVSLRTFGNFEIFIDGEPVKFKYDRTKEMLAYLVDRRGAYCTNAEIMAILWKDEKRSSYLSNLKKDLQDTLREKGYPEVLDSGWNKLRIRVEKVDCDYYDWCEGKAHVINQYRGEYMAQYDWAEFTNAELSKRIDT